MPEFNYERAFGPEKAKYLAGLSDEQLAAIENSSEGYLKAGIDSVCNLGLIEPQSDFVLLRGITADDVVQSELVVRPDGDRLGEIYAFEIMKVGPAISDAENLPLDVVVGSYRYPAGTLSAIKVGAHCVHLASSADLVDPAGQGRFHLVRARYIPCVWDPKETRGRILAMISDMKTFAENQRRKANGLPEV